MPRAAGSRRCAGGRGSLSGSDSGGWGTVSFLVPIAAFAAVGGVLTHRRQENRIGWLLLVIGLLFAVVAGCSSISRWALETDALPTSLGEWISVGSSAWVPGLGLIGTELALRLPNGELLSPRWTNYSRLCVALIALALAAMAVQPGRVEDIAGTSNPLGVSGAEPLGAVFLLVILSFLGATASLVLRYRRAGRHDRAQLRWVAFGGVVFLAIYLVTLAVPAALGLQEHSVPGVLITSLSQVGFAALPVAIGYAILRHQLYDIDAVINRTLVYGALTAILAAAYLGSVLVLQLLLRPLTEDSNLAIAGSTLAVAALFGPARARIQATVDRRFFRRKYNAARTLEAFASRLRDEVDLGALNAELGAVVRETLQPAHVSLWLRAPGEPR